MPCAFQVLEAPGVAFELNNRVLHRHVMAAQTQPAGEGNLTAGQRRRGSRALRASPAAAAAAAGPDDDGWGGASVLLVVDALDPADKEAHGGSRLGPKRMGKKTECRCVGWGWGLLSSAHVCQPLQCVTIHGHAMVRHTL